MRPLSIVLLLAAIGATIASLLALQDGTLIALSLIPLLLTWALFALALMPSTTPLKRTVTATMAWLHSHPAIFWLALLVFITWWIGSWLVIDQPTYGRFLRPTEYLHLLSGFALVVFALFFHKNSEQLQTIGAKLSKNPLTGVLITATFLLVVFFFGEAYLRLFYITTDAYGFTAMNYHWYQNFGLAQNNSLGFRDFEPLPDTPQSNITHIAIVGDSFAMGHGIDARENTFAQYLEQSLGQDYDVNLVAKSGWDTDIALSQLENYPIQPQIVILSYYLNDIDYLLAAPELNPDNNFTFIENETLHWFVLNFFLPNFVYYNLLQYTQGARAENFIADLTSPYFDEAIWSQQSEKLTQLIDWAEARQMQFVVLTWPHLLAIDETQPAIQRVEAIFQARGIPVVNMGAAMSALSPAERVVNRFDAHPSILAHRLAAEALYPVVQVVQAQTASD
jgi:GDSL-like Lipase/Acylhydrolase family